MTFDDRMNALPDDEEISRKYPRQDAPGIFEIDTETDIDTHFACWKFPIIPSPRARWADVDLFGTVSAKLIAPMKTWSPLPDILPCRMKVRQHVDGRAHSGELRDEARKLYNAMSFKVLRDGWGFNTFITVTAKYLGLTSHAEFAALIPVMNKAVASWLKARPKRSARFHITEEANHSYLFVLERSGYTHGLHFHMLCTVPVDLRDEFRVFLADWWEQQSGLAASTNTVNVKYSNSWGRPEHYANQALKFRYTIKTVPEDFWVFDQEGRKRYAVEFMKPWLRHGERPDILPIRTRQIYGISRDLDTKARQTWGEEVGWTFVSKFDQRRLDELYSGSEVQAWQARFINEQEWWKLY